MDELVFIKKSTLTDIGDGIREMTGISDLIPPLEMKSAILSIAGDNKINGFKYTCGTFSFE